MNRITKLILSGLLIFIITGLNADAINDNQNQKYLIKLNDNLISTIDMLNAFHEKSLNIMQEIEHFQEYDQFLLTMTMECSNLIENIRSADSLSVIEREDRITALIATIKPDVDIDKYEINDEKNQKNSVYLLDVTENLMKQKAQILNLIVEEEKQILETGEISVNYMRLHTHNFLFSLILNFIEPQKYLSTANRNYLVDIVKSVDEALPKRNN